MFVYRATEKIFFAQSCGHAKFQVWILQICLLEKEKEKKMDGGLWNVPLCFAYAWQEESECMYVIEWQVTPDPIYGSFFFHGWIICKSPQVTNVSLNHVIWITGKRFLSENNKQTNKQGKRVVWVTFKSCINRKRKSTETMSSL